MEIDIDKATSVFLEFEPSCQAITLHPAFVLADSKRNDELTPIFWLYEETTARYFHAFHLSKIKNSDYSDLQSAYGYGGPIANTVDPGFLSRSWNAFREWCHERKIIAEFLRFHPMLQNWNYYGGVTLQDRQTVWIDLHPRDLMPTYDKRVRTAIRKAAKAGLKVRWLEGHDALALFPGLYRDALREITQDEFFNFPETYFAALFELSQAKLAIATLASEVVAAAIFLWGTKIMEYHLSAVTGPGRVFNATSLLIHEAGIAGRERGCESLYLGGGTDARPDNPLFFFKAGFSPQRSDFRIGRFVHGKEAYESMKARFVSDYQKHPERILFYR